MQQENLTGVLCYEKETDRQHYQLYSRRGTALRKGHFDSRKEPDRTHEKHHLRGTFLLQYDALLMAEYTDLLRALDPTQFELGVWHEIVQPQAEACGIPWRGRYSWDWHCHCGFLAR
jgi:hypothetical protein